MVKSGQSISDARGELKLRGFRWWANAVWVISLCRPCRGFLVVLDMFSHRFRGGLRCAVPPGLLVIQN